jgi:hypothetical protein
MRRRLLRAVLLLAALGVTLSLTWGQVQHPSLPVASPEAGSARPSTVPPAPASRIVPPSAGQLRSLDLARLNDLQKQVVLATQRGASWLSRMNGVNGRFLHGWLPDVRAEMEGDHFLRQAGATYALALASRFTGDDRDRARAAQAILSLLDETVADPKDPKVRYTALPSAAINRLAAAGFLVLAICELPSPTVDLLDRSEQLCAYIRSQARAEGSLCCTDAGPAATSIRDDGEAAHTYPGLALYALMRSQKHRPAPWKIELVRKSAGFYQTWWQNNRSLSFVRWQTAACTEAYLASKDEGLARFVAEMNDWVCSLQYERTDPRRPLWYGGFMGWADGKAVEAAPGHQSALGAESLAEAARLARALGDVGRFQRYQAALERVVPFLLTLQYNEANTQHFADWYRPRLVGGFHASHQDGNLRIDYTQHALTALLLYLEHAVR